MPLEALYPQFDLWSHYLDSHQSGNLFFLKNTGILPRLLQFVDYYNKSHKSKLKVLDLEYSSATDAYTLEQELSRLNSPTIVITRTLFTRPDTISQAHAIQQHYLTSPHGLLIAHECAPHELYINSTQLPSSLCVHPTPYSLPINTTEIVKYTINTLKLWKIMINEYKLDIIIEYCGNQPWLINEFARLWDISPNATKEEIINHTNLKFRVKTLHENLPSAYRLALSAGKGSPEIKSELRSFGLLDSKNNPMGTWLADSIKTHQNTLLSTTPERLVFDQIDLSQYFSPGERRLTHLFTHSDKHITRELVAQTFYNSVESDYSDWALSQIITRLRTKLVKHNIPLNITTKRGVGYVATRD